MIAYRCRFIHLTIIGLNPATMQNMIDTEAQPLKGKAIPRPTTRGSISIYEAGSDTLVGIRNRSIIEIATDKYVGRLLMDNLYMHAICLLSALKKGRAQLLLHLLFEGNCLYLSSKTSVACSIFCSETERLQV